MRIGLIGCGIRGIGLARLALDLDRNVSLAAVADPNMEATRKRLEGRQIALDQIRFHRDDDELLAKTDDLDGLIIATRCHQHTPMAVKAAATGLPLYLEKPVAIDEKQLEALSAAFGDRDDDVVVSFPLRMTPVFQRTMEIVRSGRLGTINQVQAFNNVSYGGHYFGGHYRNYNESGGLWLQKATHDLDYINAIMNCAPRMIAGTSTHTIFAGDKPHDLKCSQCDETDTCMESPLNIRRRGDSGGMNWDQVNPDDPHDHWCCYSREIRNEDSGSALVLYEDGSHACYSQNFVTRRSAGERGARITGYKGSLDMEFNGHIRVVEHHRNVVENIEVKATGGHCGGDAVLMSSFLGIIRKTGTSCAPLSTGILSAAMCLAARKSAEAHTFEKIVVP